MMQRFILENQGFGTSSVHMLIDWADERLAAEPFE
jgi:hypothetical protein